MALKAKKKKKRFVLFQILNSFEAKAKYKLKYKMAEFS